MSCARGCCPSQAEHYRSLVLDGVRSPYNRRWDEEMAAYRTVRDNGGQPPNVKVAPEYLRAVGG